MFRISNALALALCAVLLSTAADSSAAKVVLRVRAANPSNTVQRVMVQENLPERVGTNDIISLGDLELGYDIKNGGYYVFKELELGPKQTENFRVEIQDIWLIPEEDIEMLEKRAKDLAALLDGGEFSVDAEALRQEVVTALTRVRTLQKGNLIKPGARVSQHIIAYESNILSMDRVKEAVGSLENMVLGSGRDPGTLVGTVKDVPEPIRDIKMEPDKYRIAKFRITVTNPSETEKKTKTLFRGLPSEITLDDILDPGGLELKADPKTGTTYVYSNAVELAAGQTRTFEVQIRDKWNINAPRIDRLMTMGSNILMRMSARERIESIDNSIASLQDQLTKIAEEQGPTTLGNDYVAYYRDQADRIDLIEGQLNRINSALKPVNRNQKLGINVKPPSSKTTWGIIYIILGFLLFMSVVFFFRWWGGPDNDG